MIFGINTTCDISKLLYLWNLRQFWNIASGIYAKYHIQIMLLFVYNTRCKRFVLFTCRYFKLHWNTTALSQSNCTKFSWCSITTKITIVIIQDDCYFPCTCTYIQVFQTYNTFSILLFQYILWKETWDMVHFTSLLNLGRRKNLQSWLVGSLLCERFRVWFPCVTSNPSFDFFTSCVKWSTDGERGVKWAHHQLPIKSIKNS